MVAYMLENVLFIDLQYGVDPKRPCMTQLQCDIEGWTKWLDTGQVIDSCSI